MFGEVGESPSAQRSKPAWMLCVQLLGGAAWGIAAGELHRGPSSSEVPSPSLGVFKNCRDVALGDVVNGHGEDGLGLDFVLSEVFSNLNDSMILCPTACKLRAPVPTARSKLQCSVCGSSSVALCPSVGTPSLGSLHGHWSWLWVQASTDVILSTLFLLIWH